MTILEHNPANIGFKKPKEGKPGSLSHQDLQFLAKSVGKSVEDLNLRLLFKASVNGDKLSDLYKFCQGHGKCFILVQTEKGYRFGGYRSKPFT